MNLFGLEIKFANRNSKYVKKEDCHEAMKRIDFRINEVRDFLNVRITDLGNKIDTIANLLKDK